MAIPEYKFYKAKKHKSQLKIGEAVWRLNCRDDSGIYTTERTSDMSIILSDLWRWKWSSWGLEEECEPILASGLGTEMIYHREGKLAMGSIKAEIIFRSTGLCGIDGSDDRSISPSQDRGWWFKMQEKLQGPELQLIVVQNAWIDGLKAQELLKPACAAQNRRGNSCWKSCIWKIYEDAV